MNKTYCKTTNNYPRKYMDGSENDVYGFGFYASGRLLGIRYEMI
jgi:hypothetical protein